jgi:hypothetical protein
MPGAFISYDREDQDLARHPYDTLLATGREPTSDQDHGAVPFSAQWGSRSGRRSRTAMSSFLSSRLARWILCRARTSLRTRMMSINKAYRSSPGRFENGDYMETGSDGSMARDWGCPAACGASAAYACYCCGSLTQMKSIARLRLAWTVPLTQALDHPPSGSAFT